MKRKLYLSVTSLILSIGLITSCGVTSSNNDSESKTSDHNTSETNTGATTSTPSSGEQIPSNSESTPSESETESPTSGEVTSTESEVPSTSGEETSTIESTPSLAESTEPTEIVPSETSSNEQTEVVPSTPVQSTETEPVEPSESIEQTVETPTPTEVVITPTPSEIEEETFFITTKDGSYSKEGNIYRINAHGSYTLSGTLNGQIYVDVEESESGDKEVELVLNGVEISYALNSPIYINSCDEVKVKAQKNTSNVITDLRDAKTSEDSTQGEGTIYSKVDMKFVGKGSLTVNGGYNNGVHSTDDLKIKNLSLAVSAPGNAIKGNDSITITSGTINATSTMADGLKTSNGGVSSKGNQKGSIEISGGSITINSYADGIDAAYNVNIYNGTDEDSGETTIPSVTIYTNKYADVDTDTPISNTTMYLRMKSNTYNSLQNYRLACYFSTGSWVNATYETSKKEGRSTYYYYKLSRPSEATSFAVYAFSSSQSENSLTSYVYKSETKSINTNYDTATLEYSSSSIYVNGWTNFQSGQGGPGGGGWGPGQEGNTDKAENSAKGIKANNDIYISGGNNFIKAYDDGIHANYGEILDEDNSSSPVGTGDVYMNGGDTTIYSSDDGVHADRKLYLNGGKCDVTESYEGYEGNQVYVTGGEFSAVSKDDGLNAGNNNNTAKLTPFVNVSGGLLKIFVSPNGDTDGIDSNGDYIQTGGIVFCGGPSSQTASSLDIGDYSTCSVTGGTLACFGRPAASFSYTSKSGTYSGTKTVTIGSESYSVTLQYSYSGLYYYSQESFSIQ